MPISHDDCKKAQADLFDDKKMALILKVENSAREGTTHEENNFQ
jgi:hypothetical protein